MNNVLVPGSMNKNVNSSEVLEQVLLAGDLSKLKAEARLQYYKEVCTTLGLNPITKPFEYLIFEGKMILYAKKDCCEQLRKIYNVSLKILSREKVQGIYVVTAQASMPSGRVDENIGAVGIEGLHGKNLANALMKAETKAKRRATLSICGLGFLEEEELDGLGSYQFVDADKGNTEDVVVPVTPDGMTAITEADLKALGALMRQRDWSYKTANEISMKTYKIGDLRKLNKGQLKELTHLISNYSPEEALDL